MDARHHPFDVISGASLGILVAWAAYRQYFPPVTETWRKGRAYPIRSWGRGPAPPPAQAPVIMVDEDVQPLRPMDPPRDVERGEASGFSTSPGMHGDPDHGGNVFRKQISDSQRRRQNDPYAPVDRSDTIASSNYRSDTMGSTMSTKVTNYQNQMPSSNPFGAPRRADTYDYSSSEDGDHYELQPGRFADTAYHRPTGISPQPTPPPPSGPSMSQPLATQTGDLGDRREVAPAPPPHAVGTAPQQI